LEHPYVAPEHILLSLLRVTDGRLAHAVLRALGASPDNVIAIAERVAARGAGRIPIGELPYTSHAKRVLDLSVTAARRLGHDHVGTEHLLLGLLGDGRLRSREILAEAGVTPEAAEAEVRRMVGGPEASARPEETGAAAFASREGRGTRVAPAAPDSAVWFLELDTSSATPIYEQIVARVEEAVATGKLGAGERMPTVRDLAEELSIAPGTVARAYSDLESRGVLETAGARGTRVANRKKSAAAVPEAELEGLRKAVVVAAFHLGATAKQLRDALNGAMRGILSGLL
jgi:DNA-binding transcriptional regulator YhcF (GntR family)